LPGVFASDVGKSKVFPSCTSRFPRPRQIRASKRRWTVKEHRLQSFQQSGSTLEPHIYKQFFFRALEGKVRRKGSWQSFYRRHRSGLQDATVRRNRKFRTIYHWRSDSRPLFAISDFAWSRSGYGSGLRQIPQNTREMSKPVVRSSAADFESCVILEPSGRPRIMAAPNHHLASPGNLLPRRVD